MSQRILVTGAAGLVGAFLRSRLARPGRTLRLLDTAPQAPVAPGEAVELIQGSVTDADAMAAACTDVDAVVHLGGLSTEQAWEEILRTNIHGTYVVLEAARRAGVPRVVFASSNHAVGFRPNDGTTAPDYAFPAPDTLYGVGKVAGEALGSLYHHRYGLDVVCLRIGSCFERPKDTRMLATWLSPDDCARLVEASLAVPAPGFRIAWGVSANTRGWFSLAEARALGFDPQDDAEQYAADVPEQDDPHAHRYLGGPFCSPALDQPLPQPEENR
ncbi:NAD-dependent epimerase/dehydratase family protein [Kitasatospora sp. NPDC048296]|uniref:NAD-dependent epimerase/dehydratase family protein n=1 Tax=Kitasatospora sp. NPDC048296 TaxID=3364048 RepID=UPI0037166F2C